MAEFIEEHTVLTKRVLRYALLGIFGLQIFLWLFEDYPFLYILFSTVALAAWATLLKQFPFIELTNPRFIVALGMPITVDRALPHLALQYCPW